MEGAVGALTVRSILHRSWIGLFLLAVFWISSPAALAVELEVKGRIFGPDRQPLEEASVTLRRVPSRAQQVFSDFARFHDSPNLEEGVEVITRSGPEGDYALRVSPGVWEIQVVAEGYSPRCLTLLPLVDDQRLPSLTLTAAKPHRVSIVDTQGAPLSGAWVRTRPESRRDYEWGECRQTLRSRDDGTAYIEVGQRGALALDVYHPGFQEVRRVVSESTASVSLRPAPRRSFEIRLEDPGSKESEIPVSVIAVAGEGRWPIAKSDDMGNLVLGALPNTVAELQLVSGDGRQARISLTDRPGLGPWKVTLPPTRIFTGRTQEVSLDEDGAMSGLPIGSAIAWDAQDPGNWVISSRDGSYRILNAKLTEHSEESQVNLLARAAGYRLTEIAMTLPGSTEGPGPGDGLQVFDELDFWLMPEDLALVTGRLVDPRGRPVADAVVRLVPGSSSTVQVAVAEAMTGSQEWEPGALAIGKSDVEGVFQIRVHPGRKTLVATHPKAAPAVYPMIEVRNSRTTTDIGDFLLTAGWALEGMVLDHLRVPLPGALVKLVVPARDGGDGVTLYSTDERREPVVANEDGLFRMDRLPERMVALKADAPGFVPSIVPVRPESSDLVIVTLHPVASLGGRVVNGEGEPVPNAEVHLSPRDSTERQGASEVRDPRRATRSDQRGRFTFADLSSGNWQLAARAPGMVSTQDLVLEVSPGEDLRGLEIRLHSGVEISGRLVTEDGFPVAGGLVQAADQRLLSEPDGSFLFPEPFASGAVVVEADHEDFGLAEELLVLTPTDSQRQVELVLRPGPSIQGRAVDPEGRPVSGILVKVAPRYPVAGDQAMTDRQGEFRFHNLAPGRYTISGRSHMGSGEVDVVITGDPITEVELVIHSRGTVRGRVVGLVDAQLEQVLVECKTPDGFVGCFSALDPSGTFEESLHLGTWSIVASLQGSPRTAAESTVLTPEDPEQEVVLDFDDSETVRGTLLLDGRPLVNAEVRLRTGGSITEVTWTDWQGEFSFEGVAGGSDLEVAPEGRDFRVQIPIAETGAAAIQIATQPLTGIVVSADGTPHPYRTLALVPIDEPRTPTPRAAGSRLLETDVEGAFSLPRVPVGRYRLELLDRGSPLAATRIEVDNTGPAMIRWVLKSNLYSRTRN